MKILASFDDGSIEDLKVAELVSKYNIETIFYWCGYPEIVNERNGRESLSEVGMKNLADEFEIGSHTMTHPLLTRIEPDVARVEIENSRKFLQDKFNQEINSFCYPRGYANPEIQQMVIEAGYTSARSTLLGYIHESENPYFMQTAIHVGYDRKEYGNYTWFSYAMIMLEKARKEPESVFHIFGHSWEIEKNDAWQEFETLLKELA